MFLLNFFRDDGVGCAMGDFLKFEFSPVIIFSQFKFFVAYSSTQKVTSTHCTGGSSKRLSVFG
jgi:hypothetical protein